MGKTMAHHWGAHKARPAQLLRTWPRAKQWIFQWLEGRKRLVAITSLSQVIGKANGMVRTPQASRQRQSHCRAKALCEAVQPCAFHARPAQLLRACHGQSNGFSNGWRAEKGMWQSLHFHKSSAKPMAWCARPRLHAKGKAIVGQKPCAKQFSRARFMRAPKECNCRAIVQTLCKNARGHRIGS